MENTPTPPPNTVNQPSHAQNEGTPGIAVASLVTSLVGLSVVGIILGIIGLKKPGGKGLSMAGIIIGVISLLFQIGFVILLIIGALAADTTSNNIRDGYNSYQDQQISEYRAIADAKKEFAKGETGVFGDLEVKVDKVTRNFVPANQFQRADAGKELIVLDLTITNKSDKSQYVYGGLFDVEDNGLLVNSSYVSGPGKKLESGQLTKDASISGQVVYEVTANSQTLKLAYTDSIYNPESSQTEELKYTLAF